MEGHDTFRVQDIEWQGRIERFDLPVSLVIADREYRAATVRDGVSTRFLRAMRQIPPSDRSTDAMIDEVRTQIRPLHQEETAARVEGLYRGIRHGDVAIRDITLSRE